MILDNPAALREAVPAGARLMGLDVGTKTIGLALSDTRRVIATPLETIRRRRFTEDMAQLFALVGTHNVGGLMIGLPLTLAGRDGPRTQCRVGASFGCGSTLRCSRSFLALGRRFRCGGLHRFGLGDNL